MNRSFDFQGRVVWTGGVRLAFVAISAINPFAMGGPALLPVVMAIAFAWSLLIVFRAWREPLAVLELLLRRVRIEERCVVHWVKQCPRYSSGLRCPSDRALLPGAYHVRYAPFAGLILGGSANEYQPCDVMSLPAPDLDAFSRGRLPHDVLLRYRAPIDAVKQSAQAVLILGLVAGVWFAAGYASGQLWQWGLGACTALAAVGSFVSQRVPQIGKNHEEAVLHMACVAEPVLVGTRALGSVSHYTITLVLRHGATRYLTNTRSLPCAGVPIVACLDPAASRALAFLSVAPDGHPLTIQRA